MIEVCAEALGQSLAKPTDARIADCTSLFLGRLQSPPCPRRGFDSPAADQLSDRRLWNTDVAPELHEADATLGDKSLDEAPGHVQGFGSFGLGQQNLGGPAGWRTVAGGRLHDSSFVVDEAELCAHPLSDLLPELLPTRRNPRNGASSQPAAMDFESTRRLEATSWVAHL